MSKSKKKTDKKWEGAPNPKKWTDSLWRKFPVDSERIGWGSVGLEEPVVALRGRAGLHVLVEHCKHVDVQIVSRPHRSSLLRSHELHEVAVVLPGVISPERPGGRRIRSLQHRQRMRGRHRDLLVQVETHESGVNALHCREQISGQSSVIEGQDFVSYRDAGDFGRRQIRLHVLLNPSLSFRRILNFRQVLVGDTHNELHISVAKSLEHFRIRVIQLQPGGPDGFHQRNHILRRRQIVSNLAVVDPNRPRQCLVRYQ
nr:hypothetical protein PanWU01x14_117670 [Ipomoea trifida]